jgi:hypothetical protein
VTSCSILAACSFVAVAGVFIFLIGTPSANALHERAAVPDDPILDNQAFIDFGAQDKQIALLYRSNNFYVFNSSSESGGDEIIAHAASNGHLEKIWQGQDIPPCQPIDVSSVPASIAPYCLSGNYLVDRSNILRAEYTSFFNRVKVVQDAFQ